MPARQDRPHPHSVFADPTGRFLLSTDLGADVIRIFSVDSSTGRLTDCPAAAAAPGDGPRHAEFWRSADKNITLLYVLNELSNSVGTYSVTYPATGGGCLTLKRESSISTYPAGKSAPNGSKAAEIHVSPDGRFVYASNRNDQSFGSRTDSMAGYSIDPATGRLTWLEASSAYSYFPRTFSINAAGDMVAIGGQTSANVAVVRRDVATGKLGPLIASIRVGNQGTVNSEDGLSAVVWNE